MLFVFAAASALAMNVSSIVWIGPGKDFSRSTGKFLVGKFLFAQANFPKISHDVILIATGKFWENFSTRSRHQAVASGGPAPGPRFV